MLQSNLPDIVPWPTVSLTLQSEYAASTISIAYRIFSRSSQTVRLARCFPLSASPKYFPFVILLPSSESLVCVKYFKRMQNWILSRQMKDDHVRGKRIKVPLCVNPLHIYGEDSFSFYTFCTRWPKTLPRKLKIASVTAQMTSMAAVTLICINSVLYWLKSAFSL